MARNIDLGDGESKPVPQEQTQPGPLERRLRSMPRYPKNYNNPTRDHHTLTLDESFGTHETSVYGALTEWELILILAAEIDKLRAEVAGRLMPSITPAGDVHVRDVPPPDYPMYMEESEPERPSESRGGVLENAELRQELSQVLETMSRRVETGQPIPESAAAILRAAAQELSRTANQNDEVNLINAAIDYAEAYRSLRERHGLATPAMREAQEARLALLRTVDVLLGDDQTTGEGT